MKVKPADRTNLVQEYYFSLKLRQIDEMRRAGSDVINLGIGSPDKPPSSGTISRLAAEAQKPNAHGYQSYNGIIELRKAFSDWYLKYFGVSLDPESEILPLLGSKEGIMHISMAYVNPGEEVLIPNPGYPTYSSVTNLVGGKVRYYDLEENKGWLPDLELLEKSGLDNVKIMWINYPNMPTGSKASFSFYERLVAFGIRNNILICNDNPYSFILNNEYLSLLNIENAMECSLELNSMSKSHNMAGWRVGMAAANGEVIKNVIKVKSNMDSGMFRPMQLAAAYALGNPDSWYESVNKVYRARRAIVESILEVLGCSYSRDQVGLFVWAHLPETVRSCADFVEEILIRADVFITPGFIFGSRGERYIRISLCADERRLEEAKERIVKFLRSV